MIREITRADFESFWPTFSAVIQAQETYAFDPNMTLEQAFALWCESPLKAFVFVDNDVVLGLITSSPMQWGQVAIYVIVDTWFQVKLEVRA